MTTKLSDLQQQPCINLRSLRIASVIPLLFSPGLTYAAAVSWNVQEGLSLVSVALPGVTVIAKMPGPLFSTYISILDFFA